MRSLGCSLDLYSILRVHTTQWCPSTQNTSWLKESQNTTDLEQQLHSAIYSQTGMLPTANGCTGMLPTANGCSHMTCAHNDVSQWAPIKISRAAWCGSSSHIPYHIRRSCCDVSELAQLVCLSWLKSCTAHNTATLGFYVLDSRYILDLGPHIFLPFLRHTHIFLSLSITN